MTNRIHTKIGFESNGIRDMPKIKKRDNYSQDNSPSRTM